MYRLIDEHQAKAADHYNQYKKIFVSAVGVFLKGLPKGSYERQFLQDVKNDKNGFVHILLSGTFEEQKDLILYLDSELTDLEKTNPDVRKCFKEQMKNLFVKGMYENSGFFSKSDHVKRVDIEICPYCGRSYIYYAEHPTKSNPQTLVKPDIDHFLPKDEYPYLAINYYNLIPTCTTCNKSPCKWDNDPIGCTRNKEYLMHPYSFEDWKIKFTYKPTSKLYDKRYIKINMTCKDADLDIGYKTWLNLDQFYSKHNGMVKNMYVQLMGLQKSYQIFTQRSFRIPSRFIAQLPELVFGYPLAPERAKEELMYKFKKDIFLQMKKQLYGVR